MCLPPETRKEQNPHSGRKHETWVGTYNGEISLYKVEKILLKNVPKEKGRGLIGKGRGENRNDYHHDCWDHSKCV